MSGGGRFQEVGSKSDPSKRRINIWIHDKFPGVLRSSGVRMFAHHEICTHGRIFCFQNTVCQLWIFWGSLCLSFVLISLLREINIGLRALNDRVQPWAMTGGPTARCKRFGLVSLGSRESGASEEGLASLHSMLGCPDPSHRYLWNAALLYYAAAKVSTTQGISTASVRNSQSSIESLATYFLHVRA